MLVSSAIYILVPIVILIAVGVYFIMFKKERSEKKAKANLDKDLSHIEMAVKEKYMYRKEIEFYYFLQSILKSDKVVFPKVGLDQILIPTGNKIAYNNISSKYVDFVIFDEKTMRPILILDVYDNSFNDEILDEQDPIVKKILDQVDIPLISVLIKGQYDKEKIRKDIYKIIYPALDNEGK